ncbi:glycine-rich family protein [Striga asiatica]|uniref:Glycine-rich family protein n=1 Tax=Striga asiatica TaxID=4170 RepID=A0A5A7PY17_STRAF|nr:glycine-rich family protein [Striga asiatica]
MAYIERGVVKSKKSFWRVSTFTEVFWAVVNFIMDFFGTLFSLEKSDAYRKGLGRSKKWDGGYPGGGPNGGGPRRAPGRMNNFREIDHDAPPACGSCCGG